MPGSPRRVPRGLAVAAAAVLLVAGCGEDTFDPATARPCDFFTEEELEEYALRIADDEETRCAYGKKPNWQDSLTEVVVEYVNGEPAALAAQYKLERAEGEAWEDSRVEYKGSVGVEYKTGRCVLLAPAGAGRSLYVAIGTDTSWVKWFSEGPYNDPCDYTEYRFEKILAKLRS